MQKIPRGLRGIFAIAQNSVRLRLPFQAAVSSGKSALKLDVTEAKYQGFG
jgi:hypothetical protein